MSESHAERLDRRLLAAGYVMAVTGYCVLLMGALRPGLLWLATRDSDEAVVTMVWVFGFAMLGVAMISSGSKLRRAYRAGMQIGF